MDVDGEGRSPLEGSWESQELLVMELPIPNASSLSSSSSNYSTT